MLEHNKITRYTKGLKVNTPRTCAFQKWQSTIKAVLRKQYGRKEFNSYN